MLKSEVFGNYRLIDRIGGGGLGEVYCAQAPDDSMVALKRLNPEHLGKDEYDALFAHEVEVAGLVTHERLLRALDSGTVDGWPFFTSKVAPAGSLRRRLSEEGVLAPDALGKLALELGDALSALHATGYTHSDLSPGNVLFIKDSAHLTDFGSATLLGTKQPRPHGTYSYMAPEQVRGDALDERSDVFSMATLLWQCATGERIFWRDAQHLTFMAVVDAALPPIANELLAVESILRSALDKEQSKRPADVLDFCRQFAEAMTS
jgi:serine/threonine protein kinase